MKIGVTGTGGFVGAALVRDLSSQGHDVVALSWRQPVVDGLDAVIHLAGLAHRLGRQRPSEADFDEGNHLVTKRLADAANASGVRRFVFVSSISVVAGHDGVLSPDMPPRPISAYGRSKADAEASLLAMPDVGPIILRPPLVYGRGAKGNMASLIRLALSPLPLPFRSVHNRRTLVSLANLVSAIAHVVTRDDLGNRVFHVTDSRPVSLAEMISAIREGAGLKPKLLAVPPSLMAAPLRIAGMGALADQLFGDLVVDGSALNEAGWHPPQDPTEGLREITTRQS